MYRPQPSRKTIKLLLVVVGICLVFICCQANGVNEVPGFTIIGDLIRADVCDTESCKECTTTCPPVSEVAVEASNCRQVQPFLKQASINDAYINCTKDNCETVHIKKACGLINVDPRHTVTSQVDPEIKKTLAQLNSVKMARKKFEEENSLSPAISLYYDQALAKIQQVKSLFRSALSARARHIKLKDFLDSLEYRKISQEVTRFKFENEDLRRHLSFWEKQYKTLALAVRTSPEGLKDARDALFSEMLSYEADAALISTLRNESLTKEERAELVIRLRENVQSEIYLTRTQYAHLLREEQFIKSARTEIFFLLRDILLKIRSGLLPVRCGGDMLSDVVGDAISSDGN